MTTDAKQKVTGAAEVAKELRAARAARNRDGGSTSK